MAHRRQLYCGLQASLPFRFLLLCPQAQQPREEMLASSSEPLPAQHLSPQSPGMIPGVKAASVIRLGGMTSAGGARRRRSSAQAENCSPTGSTGSLPGVIRTRGSARLAGSGNATVAQSAVTSLPAFQMAVLRLRSLGQMPMLTAETEHGGRLPSAKTELGLLS